MKVLKSKDKNELRELNKKNIIYLKRAQMAVIADEKALDDAKYEKKDTNYLAQRKNIRCFIHSRYDVSQEVESMFLKTPKNIEHIMLLGCGLGAAVRYALNSRNFPALKRLTIVEPSPMWADVVMTETDMEKAWGKNIGKVSFLVGFSPDYIGRLAAKESLELNENFFMAYHLSIRTLFSVYYREIVAEKTNQIQNFLMLLATNKKSLHKTVYNTVLNLAYPSYDFADIMDMFKGKNVIVVSAGSSLEKNIHLLENAKKKAIVVAVGTAIGILDARGIKPHFCMALDPSHEQYGFFKNLKEGHEHAPLIYANSLYSEILPSYKGHSVRINTEYDKLSILLHTKRLLKAPSFPTGPSITNLAAEAFCASGCKRLVFVGQDMCMYNYQLHADSGEHQQYKTDKKNENIFLKDIFGNSVVTSREYYIIKQYLEKTIAHFDKKIEFINATEGGLGIYGVFNKLLSDVLAAWEEDDISEVIDERFKKIKLRDFQNELGELREKIDEISRLNDENLKNLRKASNIFLKDSQLIERERYMQTIKKTQNNEQQLRKIDWYSEFLLPFLDVFLEADYFRLKSGIKSADEKLKLRSVLEKELLKAQAAESFFMILNEALEKVFLEEIKAKETSMLVK